MKVKLVYTGRSGRFKRGKTYNTTCSSVGRGGSRSPSTWVFTLNKVFKKYRISPYEFKKYWKYLDPSQPMILLLREVYCDSYFKDLIYAENPFLAMIKKEPFSYGVYLPVPVVYEKPEAN